MTNKHLSNLQEAWNHSRHDTGGIGAADKSSCAALRYLWSAQIESAKNNNHSYYR